MIDNFTGSVFYEAAHPSEASQADLNTLCQHIIVYKRHLGAYRYLNWNIPICIEKVPTVPILHVQFTQNWWYEIDEFTLIFLLHNKFFHALWGSEIVLQYTFLRLSGEDGSLLSSWVDKVLICLGPNVSFLTLNGVPVFWGESVPLLSTISGKFLWAAIGVSNQRIWQRHIQNITSISDCPHAAVIRHHV